MSDASASVGRRLETLLGERVESLRELDVLSRAMESELASESSDLTRVVELLSRRESIIADLGSGEPLVRELIDQWSRIDDADERCRLRVRRLSDAFDGLLSTIRERDGQTMTVMARMRDELSEGMEDIARGQVAIRAYGGAEPAPSRFEDRDG